MRENLFIALEGIDGSGKSTQTKLLSQSLSNLGHKIYSTCEPTDRPVGAMIRNILKGEVKADEKVIAGLFVADRLDHLLNEENGVMKKLQEGFTVITDRYYFSSYAYHGTHMDMNWVIKANEMSASILRPDVNIFIDVPVEISMQRLSRNRKHIELYETRENLTNVREKYMDAFEKLKNEENILVVSGNRSVTEIADDIFIYVKELLQKRQKDISAKDI